MDTATFADVRRLDRQLAPVLTVSALTQVSPTVFLACLKEYASVVDQHHPELALPTLLERLPAEMGARLTAALLKDDAGAIYDLAMEAGVAAEQLYFVGGLAARPFLWAYARSRAPEAELIAFGAGGRCPVCGRRAHMGHIDADHVKHLHCPACETVWRTARVGCAFCGCTEPGKVGYFIVEGDPAHRVEQCTACGGYLKVIDQREGARPADYLLEDVATEYLDELALTYK